MQGYYAGRVVVPVVTDNVLRTWVARDWAGTLEPKALMPPDAQAGRALFGYDRLSPVITAPEWTPRGRVYVVEGVFDAIAMWEKGRPETVATLGAHITNHQRRLLKRKGYTRVTLVRDGDTAGVNAAVEEARGLHAARFDVSIAQLPDGVDPGSATLQQLDAAVNEASPIELDYGSESIREALNG